MHHARASCYAWGKGCHLRELGEAGGMCWQEPCRSQQGQVQGPAPGKDEPPAVVPAGIWPEGAALLRSPWASWQRELGISQQSALVAKRANNILGCVTRCRVGRWKKLIISSFLRTHWTPSRVSCSVLDPQKRKDDGKLEWAENPLHGQGLSTDPGRAEGWGLIQPRAETAVERNLQQPHSTQKGGRFSQWAWWGDKTHWAKLKTHQVQTGCKEKPFSQWKYWQTRFGGPKGNLYLWRFWRPKQGNTLSSKMNLMRRRLD